MDDEASAIGLGVNWDNTKIQALGTHQPYEKALDTMDTRLQWSINLFTSVP